MDPFDYPRRWEADVVLSDGGTVHLRPIVPTDADALLAFHGRLSERTRYFRYFGPYPRIPEKDLRRFSTVDHHGRVAFVALLGDDIIAVGRYERLPDADSAEVAFVVEDAHQGRGLGSILLEHLARRRASAGWRSSRPRCWPRTPRWSGCSATPATRSAASSTRACCTWSSPSTRPRPRSPWPARASRPPRRAACTTCCTRRRSP
ncbi:GNAT family N-acetyltransferase [Actinokineospora soli]|uniref:GNAT family N-acetyltransferase n=1 Tax=Actinokineospora soli TaxID=1048753 RepID=A0ABW2TKD4_9PSEU